MRQKGGSGMKALLKTPVTEPFTHNYKAPGVKTYSNNISSRTGRAAVGPYENAHIWHDNFNYYQNKLVKSFNGGSKGKCGLGWSYVPDGITPDGDILIPQFNEINPAGPVNANSASLTNNTQGEFGSSLSGTHNKCPYFSLGAYHFTSL